MQLENGLTHTCSKTLLKYFRLHQSLSVLLQLDGKVVQQRMVLQSQLWFTAIVIRIP